MLKFAVSRKNVLFVFAKEYNVDGLCGVQYPPCNIRFQYCIRWGNALFQNLLIHTRYTSASTFVRQVANLVCFVVLVVMSDQGRPHGGQRGGALSPLEIKMPSIFLCLNLQNKSKYIYLN